MLGGYYGEESLNTEFKQFCNQFPSLLEEYFNEDELEEFLLNGRWTDKVNDLVNENIINYMAYIPQKYISCFGNSKIKGNLIIGVDDSGEITGIPYNGNLDLDYIKSLLKNTMPTLKYPVSAPFLLCLCVINPMLLLSIASNIVSTD